MSKKLKLLALMIICAFIVGACQNDNSNEPTSNGNKLGAATSEVVAEDGISKLFAPEIGGLNLPHLEELNGRLVFSYQNALYIGGFNDDTKLIASNVLAENVYLAPNSESLVYIAKEENNFKLILVNLKTLEAHNLYDFPAGNQWFSVDWSLDSNWIAFTHAKTPPPYDLIASHLAESLPPYSDPNFLVLIDVNMASAKNTEISIYSTAWLSDGTLLVTTLPYTGGNLEEKVFQIDPETSEARDIGYQGFVWEIFEGITDLATWQSAQASLQALGLNLAPPKTPALNSKFAVSPSQDRYVSTTEIGNTPSGGSCKQLGLVIKGITISMVPEIVYQTEQPNGLNVNSLKWLEDNSIFFALQTSQTCESIPDGAILMRVVPDGETETITENLAYSQGQPYTISPDGRYVAWVGIDREAGLSFLGITDLQNGTGGMLLSANLDSASDESTNPPFSAVYWIP